MDLDDLDLAAATTAISRAVQRVSGALDALQRDIGGRGSLMGRTDPKQLAQVLAGFAVDLDEADADLQALAHVLKGLSFTPPLPIKD